MKKSYLLFTGLILILSVGLFSCKKSSIQKDASVTPDVEEKSITPADTISGDSIHMFAELLYDSISYVVLENRSPLPIIYNSEYQFEQKVYGKWKSVKVKKQDTTTIVLAPGGIDTLKMELYKDIGYQPIGACRIYKTIRTANYKQQFEYMSETDARVHQIDWTKVELIPDNTTLNTDFVTMVASLQGNAIFTTIKNKTQKEITFGDGTNFSLSIFQDGKWYTISYARMEHSLAVILRPEDSINNLIHYLPDVNYQFKPGRYRIMKDFFFSSDYKNKYFVGAEFSID